jgi:hypothetical protein
LRGVFFPKGGLSKMSEIRGGKKKYQGILSVRPVLWEQDVGHLLLFYRTESNTLVLLLLSGAKTRW